MPVSIVKETDMRQAFGYCRVSRERQEETGYSFDAQAKTIDDFAAANRMRLIDIIIETDAGWRSNRIGLRTALAECRKHDAILLIPKLDRLSRNVAFISALIESKVEFILIDNPTATKFVKHILAAVAEYELDMIRTRTKEALAAAKRQGVELGWYGKLVTSKFNQFHADMFACRMRPIVESIKARGLTTVRAIVAELNRMKVPTYQKDTHKWHVQTVHRLLKRLMNTKT
jgi:DNA invertase Pin-like site-specific DNA recombinase